MKGIAVALVLFFVQFGLTYLNVYGGEGYEWDFQSFGYAASGALVLIVNIQVLYTSVHCIIMSVIFCSITYTNTKHAMTLIFAM